MAITVGLLGEEMYKILGVAVALAILVAPNWVAGAGTADTSIHDQTEWQTLVPGLDYGVFKAPRPSIIGDSQIMVARIDPRRFKLDLYSTFGSEKNTNGLPIDIWMRNENLVAAINAGMFESNGKTTGYSRIGNKILNPNWKTKYGATLVIDPDDPALPSAVILDNDCDNVQEQQKHYRIVLQSMRLIDCKGANLWPISPRSWSTAALGIDDQGRLLFIHARSPWDVHDFIDILKELPLGMQRAMYLEGGPEASLSVQAGDLSVMHVGSWETGFNENDNNTNSWQLPNIIGVRRIDREK